MRKTGMGGHQSAVMMKEDWCTPPGIIKKLGPFDLDPCSPVTRPWPTAKKHYTKIEDGLRQPWFGRVFLNPPYGNKMAPWLHLMSQHRNGIALVFARTETKVFRRWVWREADMLLFLYGRLTFYTIEGALAEHNAGAPSVLCAYGSNNCEILADCGIDGEVIPLKKPPIIIIGISPSWKDVVKIVLARLNGPSGIAAIYELVDQMAPDKTAKNRVWKEKVRQTLRRYCQRIKRGVYA